MNADQTEDRQKNCLEKLTWESQEKARAAAAYADYRYGYGQSGAKPRPYQCKYCRKWHLARG